MSWNLRKQLNYLSEIKWFVCECNKYGQHYNSKCYRLIFLLDTCHITFFLSNLTELASNMNAALRNITRHNAYNARVDILHYTRSTCYTFEWKRFLIRPFWWAYFFFKAILFIFFWFLTLFSLFLNLFFVHSCWISLIRCCIFCYNEFVWRIYRSQMSTICGRRIQIGNTFKLYLSHT